MIIIPAIDIIEGKSVRLTEGDYTQKKIYNERPLEVARQFEDAGLQRLHLVDLDGAREGRVRNWKVLEAIAGKTRLEIDFSGGIAASGDLDIVFNSGATWAAIGSLAVKNEMEFIRWISKYGPDRFLLGADVRDQKIAIKGWQEQTEITVFEFIETFLAKGIEQVFCTDIRKDGKLQGPGLELYKEILNRLPNLRLIASGGISNMKDIEQLDAIGCSGAIIGKAIYENKISLPELVNFNKN